MTRDSLTHVSIWLSDDSSNDGSLPQAMDWASRLGLPLRVVVTSTHFANGSGGEDGETNGFPRLEREPAPIIEKIKMWGLACAQRGIIMETSFWVGETKIGIDRFLRPLGLCVFEGNRSDAVRDTLLAPSNQHPEVLLLLAPRTFKPMRRVLILHNPQDGGGFFLETVARLCQALDVQPLILTMASSERDALLKQRFAEGVCSSLHLQADFDAAVSFDFPSAVDRVAAWRNCSHVFFERPQKPRRLPVWQRWRGDIFSELRRVSESLTFLALPGTLALDFPHKTRAAPLGRSGPKLIESSPT